MFGASAIAGDHIKRRIELFDAVDVAAAHIVAEADPGGDALVLGSQLKD